MYASGVWFVSVLVLCVTACSAEEDLPWWRTAILYQVYPRSFKDSDGDGVGDIKGITQKASYLKDIGVEAIWFCPINKSPMIDAGYDISDFIAIEPIFGTSQDLDELMAELKRLNIRLLLDFVPNHTSDQHIWFQASSNTSHPLHKDYRDFYVWQKAKGKTANGTLIPPSNWLSVFRGSSWEWNEDRQQFYLHHFAKEQPDLNYRCPDVVSNMTAILNYWVDKGVDGIRMDAVKFIFENASFPDQLPVPGTDGSIHENMQHNYDNNQPETFELITNWTDMIHQRVLQDGRQRAIFNEVYDPIDLIMKYYGVGNRSMQITFNFGIVETSRLTRPADLKLAIDSWMEKMPEGAVPNWVSGNHDKKRVSTHYGNEMVDAVNMLTATLPGVQCVYYGEEIGMEDTFVLWNETVDPRGLLAGPENYQNDCRDPQRTPMQWDNSTSAGFSTKTTPWLPVNPNYWWLNVAAQRDAPVSHLKVFQAMAKVRKDPVLQRGNLNVSVPSEDTLVVIRRYQGAHYVLIINMGSEVKTYTSQNLFNQHGIDTDMTIVVTSINSGYSPGLNLRGGLVSVVLRPKAAILLRSGSTETSLSESDRSTGYRGYFSTFLLFCCLFIIKFSY